MLRKLRFHMAGLSPRSPHPVLENALPTSLFTRAVNAAPSGFATSHHCRLIVDLLHPSQSE